MWVARSASRMSPTSSLWSNTMRRASAAWFMACATRLPRGLIGILVGLTGLALMADIGSWWLAKQADVFVYVIVGAGGVYNGGTALLVLLITLDMWLPKGRARA